ncbi:MULTISPECIES: serine hydrolase domain-containing protein [Sorangium]|uniref:Beta-lactamase-related domain-containing protein n=1 Tax=Sorangium cellulosum TaxID=56 RepID=A0A4V0NFG7_SORCE|nr:MULTISPECIES: serine hydrolase domain-containing protein [Sorangium]AUX29612.1 uncharacterized protein SOCE836_017030 [Sorangium cellulosum]WCQ89006.1 hypothetical protein NQZ70_01689 [Sorangium sp. Soce836]
MFASLHRSKPRAFFQVLGAVSLVAATAGLSAPARGAQLNVDEYEDQIRSRFGSTKGYSTTLVRTTGFRYGVSGGAATHSDAMTWNVLANVGSATKMVGGLLLVKVLEEQGKSTPQVLSFLDNEIRHYLPAVVKNALPVENRKITFRDLLQHKSGIRGGDPANPFVQLLVPVEDSDYGVRSYHNINSKLLTYLVPIVGNPANLPAINDAVANNGWSATGNDIIQAMGWWYETFVRYYIFDPVDPDLAATCDPDPDALGTLLNGWTIAGAYTTKTDPYGGVIYNSKVLAGHCKAQGGWYYSSKAFASIFQYLGHSSGFISPSTYDALYSPTGSSAARNNRLVWSSEIASAKLEDLYGWKASPYHGGSHPVNRSGSVPSGFRTTHARAAVIRLPSGYHAVGIVNSGEMSSGDIASELKNAFANALE